MIKTFEDEFLQDTHSRMRLMEFLSSREGQATIAYLIASCPAKGYLPPEDKAWQQVRADAFNQGWIAAVIALQGLPETMAGAALAKAEQDTSIESEFTASPDLPDHSDIISEHLTH